VSEIDDATGIDIPDTVAEYARTSAAKRAYLFYVTYLSREDISHPSWEQLSEPSRDLWRELTGAVDDGFSDGLVRGLRLHETGSL
jgi:hypothetical protein